MRGKVRKAVTSGRLTGASRGSPTSASCPEPTFSLYSTDSEDQVTTLHQGLDRCAALLGDILQAEKAASPSLQRTVKVGAARSRQSTSLGGKSIEKLPTKTVQKSSHSSQRGPGTTPRTHRSTPPAAHSGVKLHPPKKHPHKLLQSFTPPSHRQTLQHRSHSVLPPRTSIPPPRTSSPPPRTSSPPPRTSSPPPRTSSPPPRTSILLAVHQSSSPPELLPSHQAGAPQTEAGGGEEFVPVRDVNMKNPAVRHPNICTVETSHLQLETQQDEEKKEKMVQYLLRELRALISGRGGAAETLLSQLDQTLSSPQVGGLNIQQTHRDPDLKSLLIQNGQLCRRVQILNQQLKERENLERNQNLEVLCDSQVLRLQEELVTAQSRLQEVQEDLTELRRVLQDTQRELRDREAENVLMKTDLDATRRRLLDREHEEEKLASLTQQRLEEIGHLNSSSDGPPPVDSSETRPSILLHSRQHPFLPSREPITHYLLSLDQAEREEKPPFHPEHRDQPPQSPAVRLNSPLDPSRGSEHLESGRRQMFTSMVSQSDGESVLSDCSIKSGWTFDTRDEEAFRDGLAALDASISNLQKTIQLDMRR
ncbi:uncharacterized protein ccdc14 [Amphiprion ocellaris]|uniref:uncharacterized protein ccdc14 n=1 Tax=Amphiprion ocellaris TaxID=80972 RepID=UPI000C3141D5|nr:uncharacterized protein ccdc14 [Amphiprion ocellaris]